MSLNARKIFSGTGDEVRLTLLAIEDISERRRAEEQRQELNVGLENKVSERTAELEQANRALVRDIEERERLEDQLRQAHKMESIGTLAAGVAHDFNNILNIILGYASLLKEHGANNEEIAESGSVIIEAAKRGAGVVQQLLTLARKTEPRLEPTDVNKLLRELMHLLQESFPKVIELNLVANHELPPVNADPNQITQALLNLCVNARDAMPDGGKLTLKTEVVAGKSLREDGEANAERYVCIAITDTGTGIDEDIQSRVFEPFFTTKRTDQGTGLGLSVVYGIVKNHKGFIQVESKPMHGATFRVYLPVASSGD
jgi:signal transduction histidine kinase